MRCRGWLRLVHRCFDEHQQLPPDKAARRGPLTKSARARARASSPEPQLSADVREAESVLARALEVVDDERFLCGLHRLKLQSELVLQGDENCRQGVLIRRNVRPAQG